MDCVSGWCNDNQLHLNKAKCYVFSISVIWAFGSIENFTWDITSIWNPASAGVYIDDIESIQKQFVIYLHLPYEDRCKQLKLNSLEGLRKLADLVLAYDIFKNVVSDDLISSKFVSYRDTAQNIHTTNRLLV